MAFLLPRDEILGWNLWDRCYKFETSKLKKTEESRLSYIKLCLYSVVLCFMRAPEGLLLFLHAKAT